MGALLAIIFGAANTYLGLRVGMTVSASIPAAVISMVVMRVILRRKSVLESNMVQTIGSAGEPWPGGRHRHDPASGCGGAVVQQGNKEKIKVSCSVYACKLLCHYQREIRASISFPSSKRATAL